MTLHNEVEVLKSRLKALENQLYNLTRNGILKSEQKDGITNTQQNPKSGVYNAQIASYGSVNDCQILYPLGYYAVAPKDAQCIVFNIAGQSEKKLAIPFDSFTRFTGLQSYDVKFGNQRIKNFISFESDGSVNIETPKGNLNIKVLEGNADITINGNLTSNISGNINTTATGNITTDTDSTYTVNAQSNVAINSDTQVQMTANGATLTLTNSSLVSSVPIQAPSIEILGTGNLTMNGGAITGNSDMTTSGGKSFNAHMHTPGTYQVNHDGVRPVTGESGTLV